MTQDLLDLPEDRALGALMDCVNGAPQKDKTLWATQMDDTDWQRFVNLTFIHRLAALAYRELRAASPDVVPSWVVETLSSTYKETLAANVVLYDRLHRILEAFQRVSIPVLPLKGAVFAQTLYPSIGTRPMGDLDLVVPFERLKDAEAILQEFGYRKQVQNPGYRSREFLLRYGGEMVYSPPRSWPLVELHWQVLFGEWIRRVTAVGNEDFWGRALPVIIDGVTVRQLAVEDSILHQIGHVAVLHGFTEMGLRVYVDLDRTIRAGADSLDWAGVIDLARRIRLTTAAYFTLGLCVNLLDTPVPPTVLRALRPSALRRQLVSRALDRERLLERRHTGTRRPKFLLQLLLVDRPRDLMRLVFRTFFPEGEWIAARYELEGWWSRLAHQLWHPVRVLVRGEV